MIWVTININGILSVNCTCSVRGTMNVQIKCSIQSHIDRAKHALHASYTG